MKLRIFLLALCSIIAFQIKSFAQTTGFSHRLDSIVVGNQSKVVFKYDNANTTLLEKDDYSWKGSAWTLTTKTEYKYDATTGKVNNITETNIDAKGKETKNSIVPTTHDGTSLTDIINKIKSQSGGENSNPTTGGWVDDNKE